MIAAAMRSHDEDWVPLSITGSHLHEVDPELDSRTYGSPKLMDLLEKTGQFEVRRDAVPAVTVPQLVRGRTRGSEAEFREAVAGYAGTPRGVHGA